MKKTNKELLDDDFDILGDLGIDEGDDDLEGGLIPKPSKDRNPVTRVAKGALSAFSPKTHGIEFIQQVAKKALPKSYIDTLDLVESAKYSASGVTEEVGKLIKPINTGFKSLVRKTFPFESKLIPSRIGKKLKDYSKEEPEERSYSESENTTQYDPQANEINDTIKTIFKAERLEKVYGEKVKQAEKEADKEREDTYFQSSIESSYNIGEGIARLVGYQDTILDKYYRKSLELQYLQVFSLKELVSFTKTASKDQFVYLQDIVKNTGLPNETKVNLAETFWDTKKKHLIDYGNDRLTDKIRKLPFTLASNLKDKFNETKENASFYLSSFPGMDMDEETKAMLGFDTYKELGSGLIGDPIRDKLAERFGSYVKGVLPKGIIERGDHVLSRFTKEYPSRLYRWLLKGQENGDPNSLAYMLSELATGALDTRSPSFNNLSSTYNQASSFDVLSRKTLTEIIPEYLSRSLEQLTNIYSILSGSTDKTDRLVYSVGEERLVPKSGLQKRINTVLKSQIGYGVKNNTMEIINYLDPDKTELSNDDRIKLALFINKQAETGKNFDIRDFLDNDDMPESIRDKVEELVKEKFEIGLDDNYQYKVGNATPILEAQKKLSRYYQSIQDEQGDFTQYATKLSDRGEKQHLVDIGLLDQNTGYINPEYKQKLLTDLFSSETKEDYFRGDRPSTSSLLGETEETYRDENDKSEPLTLKQVFFIDEIEKQEEIIARPEVQSTIASVKENKEKLIESETGKKVAEAIHAVEEKIETNPLLQAAKQDIQNSSLAHVVKEEFKPQETVETTESTEEEKQPFYKRITNKVMPFVSKAKQAIKSDIEQSKTLTELSAIKKEVSESEQSKKLQETFEHVLESPTIQNLQSDITTIKESLVDKEKEAENEESIPTTKKGKFSLVMEGIQKSKTLQSLQQQVNDLQTKVKEKVEPIKQKVRSSETIASIDETLNKTLASITENTKTISEAIANNDSLMGSSNSQLDKLINLNEDYAKSSISLLERIASGVEAINLSSTDGAILNDIERLKTNQFDLMNKKSFIGHGIDFVKGGFKGLARLRSGLKPVREAISKRALGLASKLFPGVWTLFKKVVSAPKVLIGKAFEFLAGNLAKIPERAKTIGKYVVNPLLGFAKDAIVFTAKNAFKATTFLLRKSVETVIKAPYRIVKRIGRLGKALKKPLGILGAIGSAGLSPFKYGFDYLKDRAFPMQIDVFKRDDAENPILTAQGFKNQEYYDKHSGKVINSVKEIRGPVVNANGEVLLSQEVLNEGLMDKDHKVLDLPRVKLAKVFSKPTLTSIKNTISTTLTHLGNRFKPVYKDVFVKGETEPRLYAELFKEGSYFDKRSGKVLKSIKDIKGEVTDKDGNTLINNDDIDQGLVDVEGNVIYQQHQDKKTTLKTKQFFGLNLTSPGALLASVTDKVLKREDELHEENVEKENKVITLLSKIYAHLQNVFPSKDSEELHNETENSARNILKRKEAARKAKEEADKKKKEGKGTTEEVKDKKNLFEALSDGIGGITSTIGTILATIGGYFGITSLKDIGGFVTSKLGSLAGGAKDLLVRNAPKALELAGTAGRAVLAAAPSVAAATETAVSATAAGAAAATTGLLAAGEFLLTNPIGWGILAGSAAIYGGYKLYKYASRRTKLKPLEMLRYLQYGLPIDNKHAVVTIRYFEDELKSDITVNKKGLPELKRSVEQLWKEYASDFGSEDINTTDYKNFSTWFTQRFLPVYVKHKVVAESLQSTLEETDDKLTPDLKYRFVTEVQFGNKEKEAGFDIFSIMSSPWHDIALADNESYIKTISDNIKNALKRGVDATLDNIEGLKSTKPTLLDVEKDKMQKSTELQKELLDQKKQKDDIDRLNELRNTTVDSDSTTSFFSKVGQFMGDVYSNAKNLFTNPSQQIQKAYSIGKEYTGKAIDWTKENIYEPIAHSLAGLIKRGESGAKGYNAYNRGSGKPALFNRDLTNMTISDILNDMSRPGNDPNRLFAVGKYQFTPAPLKEAIEKLKVPGSTVFDAKTQEYLFSKYFLDKKRPKISAYIKGKSDDVNEAAIAAAAEWASIADIRTGKPYGNYASSGNRASIAPSEILAALKQTRELYAKYRQEGLPEDEAFQKAASSDGSQLAKMDTSTGNMAPVTGGTPVGANNTASPEIPPMVTADIGTPPIVPSKPLGGPTVEAANALNLPTSSDTGTALNLPTANNDASTAIPKLPTKEPITTTPEIAKVEEDKTVQIAQATSTPVVNVVNQTPVDLSSVNKSLDTLNKTSSDQRDLHLAEQQKQTSLLAELLEYTKTIAVKPESKPSNNVVLNQQQSSSMGGKPIINMGRKAS